MFAYCSSLESFLKSTPKLQNAYGMFRSCKALKEVGINFDNITSASYMFYDCDSLPSFTNTSTLKLKSANYMFKDCAALKSVDMNLSALTNAE